MNKEEIQGTIETTFDIAWTEMEKLATRVFHEVVVPYCKRWKLSFWCGNGEWSFGITEHTPPWVKEKLCYGNESVDNDRIHKKVREILDVPLDRSMSLGCYMPNYTYKGE